MHQTDCMNDMMPMTAVDSSGHPDQAVVTRLGLRGMEFEAQAMPSGRFAWLDFHLPENGHRVKALGEITCVLCSNSLIRVFIDFKHVFPADRIAMSGFLQSHAVAA